MGDDQYPRKLAQVVVAELLKAKGIEAVQLSSLEVLEDLLLRYLAELGRQAHKNAEIARRTVCNPLDVVRTLFLDLKQEMARWCVWCRLFHADVIYDPD